MKIAYANSRDVGHGGNFHRYVTYFLLKDRLLKLEILFVNKIDLRFRLLELSATDHTIYLSSLKLSNRLLCRIKDNIFIFTQGKVFFLKI